MAIVHILDNVKAKAESLEKLIWELRRLFRELAAAADQELQSLGIQAADRALLEFLARESEPVSISDLARKHSLSRQHIHQSLQRLPNPGWIEQIPDPTDRRAILLQLSRKGWDLWQKIRTVDSELLIGLAAGLSQDRIRVTTEVLGQLRTELSSRKDLR